MDRLIAFLELDKQKKKATFVGFVAALCALFMSVSAPIVPDAKAALAVIQLFWLILLTISLTSLFIDLVVHVWHEERRVSAKYDLPFNYIITATIGAILGGVILNLWRYMLALYTDTFAVFTVLIGFPSFVTIGCILVAIFIKKREDKIAPIFQMFADSIILGALVGVGGFYLQQAITKLFYLYWFLYVAPAVALAFFVLIVGLALYRKQKLWS